MKTKRILSMLICICMLASTVLSTVPTFAVTENVTENIEKISSYPVTETSTATNEFLIPVEQKTEVPEGYIGIYTAEDLDNVRNDLSANYILMADIDLSGVNWIPIGIDLEEQSETSFGGMFDGNGYAIDNMYICVDINYPGFANIGLFSALTGGTIQNLKLTNISIVHEEYVYNEYFGGIVGYSYCGTIDNCVVLGEINVNTEGCGYIVGGAVAESEGTITNVHTSVVINYNNPSTTSGGIFAGGIVGKSISNVSNNKSHLSIENCRSNSIITCEGQYGYVGGIAGQVVVSSGSIYSISNNINWSELYSTAEVGYTGGIIGDIEIQDNSGLKIHNCQNVGIIVSGNKAGGIVSSISSEGSLSEFSIDQCVNTGDIDACGLVGGIIGGLYLDVGGDSVHSDINPQMINCYNSGNVVPIDESAYVGGLFGVLNTGSVSSFEILNSYVVSEEILGVSRACLIGFALNDSTDEVDINIESVYCIDSLAPDFIYSTDISGNITVSAEKLSDEEMQSADSFVGFDFDSVWEIGTAEYYNYPTLIDNPHRGFVLEPEIPEEPSEITSTWDTTDVTLNEGEEYAFIGSVSTTAENGLKDLQININSATDDTVGIKYYRAENLGTESFDLSAVPSLTVNAELSDEDQTIVLAPGTTWEVQLWATDTEGNSIGDAEIMILTIEEKNHDISDSDLDFLLSIEHKTEVPEGYIGIYTAEDLDNVRNDLESNYILMADIDLSEYDNWIPIGYIDDYSQVSFRGIFDGNGYTISHLRTSTSKYSGLFCLIYCGEVKNLRMTNAYCISSSRYVAATGIIAGFVNSSTITNCIVEGSAYAEINEIHSGSVSGGYRMTYASCGGVVGISENSVVSYCMNFATVKSCINDKDKTVLWSISGGIIGSTYSQSSILYCVNYGDVIAENEYSHSSVCGGITGGDVELSMGNITVTHCENFGDIVVKASPDSKRIHAYIGGIFGRLSGNIYHCRNYSTINLNYLDVTNSNYQFSIGGIGGEVRYDSCVSECLNSGEIHFYSNDGSVLYIGGIIGEAGWAEEFGSFLEKCWNSGNIMVRNNNAGNVGGLIGFGSGITVCDSYNSNTIDITNTSEGDVAGLIGCFRMDGDISGSLYNCYDVSEIILNSVDNDWAYSIGYIIGDLFGYELSYIDEIIIQDNIYNNYYKNNEYNGIGNMDYEDSLSIISQLSYYEMSNFKSFSGFDFDNVWEIGVTEGYPYPTLRDNPHNGSIDIPEVSSEITSTWDTTDVTLNEGEEYSFVGSVSTTAENGLKDLQININSETDENVGIEYYSTENIGTESFDLTVVPSLKANAELSGDNGQTIILAPGTTWYVQICATDTDGNYNESIILLTISEIEPDVPEVSLAGNKYTQTTYKVLDLDYIPEDYAVSENPPYLDFTDEENGVFFIVYGEGFSYVDFTYTIEDGFVTLIPNPDGEHGMSKFGRAEELVMQINEDETLSVYSYTPDKISGLSYAIGSTTKTDVFEIKVEEEIESGRPTVEGLAESYTITLGESLTLEGIISAFGEGRLNKVTLKHNEVGTTFESQTLNIALESATADLSEFTISADEYPLNTVGTHEFIIYASADNFIETDNRIVHFNVTVNPAEVEEPTECQHDWVFVEDVRNTGIWENLNNGTHKRVSVEKKYSCSLCGSTKVERKPDSAIEPHWTYEVREDIDSIYTYNSDSELYSQYHYKLTSIRHFCNALGCGYKVFDRFETTNIPHTKTTEKIIISYELSPILDKHRVWEERFEYCTTEGCIYRKSLGKTYRDESHTYINGICINCGYEQQTTQDTSVPEINDVEYRIYNEFTSSVTGEKSLRVDGQILRYIKLINTDNGKIYSPSEVQDANIEWEYEKNNPLFEFDESSGALVYRPVAFSNKGSSQIYLKVNGEIVDSITIYSNPKTPILKIREADIKAESCIFEVTLENYSEVIEVGFINGSCYNVGCSGKSNYCQVYGTKSLGGIRCDVSESNENGVKSDIHHFPGYGTHGYLKAYAITPWGIYYSDTLYYKTYSYEKSIEITEKELKEAGWPLSAMTVEQYYEIVNPITGAVVGSASNLKDVVTSNTSAQGKIAGATLVIMDIIPKLKDVTISYSASYFLSEAEIYKNPELISEITNIVDEAYGFATDDLFDVGSYLKDYIVEEAVHYCLEEASKQ